MCSSETSRSRTCPNNISQKSRAARLRILYKRQALPLFQKLTACHAEWNRMRQVFFVSFVDCPSFGQIVMYSPSQSEQIKYSQIVRADIGDPMFFP